MGRGPHAKPKREPSRSSSTGCVKSIHWVAGRTTIWYPKWDLNPHSLELDFESSASADSAIRARKEPCTLKIGLGGNHMKEEQEAMRSVQGSGAGRGT